MNYKHLSLKISKYFTRLEEKAFIKAKKINIDRTKCGDPVFHITSNSDSLGVITDCNMAASRLVGLERAKLLGHYIEDFMPKVYAVCHKGVLERSTHLCLYN